VIVDVQAIVNDRLFNPAVDLLLSPTGGGDKPVHATELEQVTNQANAACPDLHEGEMERRNQPMEEGEAGLALKNWATWG